MPNEVAGYRRLGTWSKKIYDVGFTGLSAAPFHSPCSMARQVPDLSRSGFLRLP